MSCLIGKQAPDFTADACLGNNEFSSIKLSDYKGKKHVVLFFWPADFTFVCASELPGFEKLYEEFKKRNVEILGCSTDTQFVHRAWKTVPAECGGIGKISYPMLADPGAKIARSYDVLLPDCHLCCRGVFLIDLEGVVQAAHFNNLPLGRNLEEVLRLVDAIQFHEKSIKEGNPQVCPASWKLGRKGMTPTPEGVVEFAKAGGLDQYVDAA